MSTFGKKSLVWWDYKNHQRDNVLRFTSTPKPLQLKILEKWYPIGMIMSEPIYRSIVKYRIVGYEETISHYTLKLERLDETKYITSKHTLMIEPLDGEIIQLKREYKINKLLD